MHGWVGRVAALLLAGAVMAVPQDVEAQRLRVGANIRGPARPGPELGIRGGYDFDAEAVSLGGQLRLPIGPFIEIVPSGDYFLAGDQTAWQANLDLAVRTGFRQVLYAGVGGALAHRAFEIQGIAIFPEDTKLGLNLFAGASIPRFLRTRIRPYIEARWTFVSDFDAQFDLVLGVNYVLNEGQP
jgi:hypothetical protein